MIGTLDNYDFWRGNTFVQINGQNGEYHNIYFSGNIIRDLEEIGKNNQVEIIPKRRFFNILPPKKLEYLIEDFHSHALKIMPL